MGVLQEGEEEGREEQEEQEEGEARGGGPGPTLVSRVHRQDQDQAQGRVAPCTATSLVPRGAVIPAAIWWNLPPYIPTLGRNISEFMEEIYI